MKVSKYLKKLGIKKSELPWNPKYCYENKKDVKRSKKETKKYGFSPKETWGLDYTFYLLMYPRLKLYKKRAKKIVDLENECYKIQFEDKEYNLLECINIVLEGFELALKKFRTDEEEKQIDKANKLFGIILNYLWW